MALPKTYDWDRILGGLRLLSESFPEVFPDMVLAGGGACWFYRIVLNQANDPDFRVPSFSVEEGSNWVSKDIDFMGLSVADAESLLQSKRSVTAASGLEGPTIRTG